MTEIQVAQGHDNTAGYSTFRYNGLFIEPLCPGVRPGIRRTSVSQAVTEDGSKSSELRWSPKIPAGAVTQIRTTLGLTGTTFQANVTVKLPDNDDRTTFSDYNALAVLDEQEDYERGGQPLIVRLLFLEAI